MDKKKTIKRVKKSSVDTIYTQTPNFLELSESIKPPEKTFWKFKKDEKLKITKCCSIPKGWGHELVIVNNEKYCGKILVFKKGCSFSMHYHIIKQETWYVNKGIFKFYWINTDNGEFNMKIMQKGDVVTIPIGQPHQLFAVEDGEIFEVSTQHFDSDSYRIWKGINQND